jgi:hypothetical protein
MHLMMLRMWFPQQVVALIGVMVCFALGGGAAGQAQTSGEPPLIPRNASALEGVPAVRLDATKESATRRTLDGAEASTHAQMSDVSWTNRRRDGTI